MGEPKALLKVGLVTIIERTVTELRRAFSEVIVVAGVPGDVGFTLPKLDAVMVFDSVPFEGPLMALKVGLGAARGEMAFVCSCDAPGLRAEVGLALCAAIGKHDAAVPVIDGRFQPLLAVYHKRSLAEIETLLATGERRLRALLARLSVRVFEEGEMRKVDPDLASLTNVNTPEAYRAWLNR
jgi:molybdopterin-guanine dinucleotide biosynthesis protein A